MELYILDKKNLSILSVSNVSEYSINMDEETNGVSEFVLLNIESARKGNYIVLNGLYKQFLFVISDDVIANKGQLAITVPALDISNIFDRKIILKNADSMSTIGIEQFIADNILDNFVDTDDSIFNLDYIDVYIHTTTLGTVTIDDENGLYNFHTFLINCRQYKNIYTDFSIVMVEGNRRLKIDIGYKLESTMLVDTTLAEVTDYNKIYEVDPVTKVECYVREDGSIYNLYLKSDRTTTTDKDDPDRLYGRIETISCDTIDKAPEESLNIIKANRYKHLVEFSIAKTSKLIDVTELYVGRPIKIKTEDSIYDSYISAITLSDENFIKFKSGNLRIDFTDKQRQTKLDGTAGNKVDVSIFSKSKIVEEKSTNNGSYIQYENGWMIVIQRIKLSVSGGTWRSWGQMYTTPDIVTPPNYPIEFKIAPSVTYSLQLLAGANAYLTTNGNLTDTGALKRAQPVSLLRPTTYNDISQYCIHIIAIGKWK